MYAEPTDLAAHMNRTFTVDEEARADAILVTASAYVDAYCGQSFELTADNEITFYDTYRAGQALVLPQWPATVTAVTIDGDAFTDYRVESSGLMFRTDGGTWPSEVVVTYTYGAAEAPAAIKAATLMIASRLFEDPVGSVSQKSSGDASISYAVSSDVNGLAPLVKTLLDAHRTPVVA